MKGKNQVNSEMINAIISVCGTIFGTILGWTLNCLHTSWMNKSKLCFSLQPATNVDENIYSESKTKYSHSGYQIEVYNIGNIPFVLDQFSLHYKEKIIVDCFITEENKTLFPYKNYIYQLSMQEYDVILRYCKKENLEKCKVVSYDIDKKKVKSNLDLLLPYTQTRV